MAPADVESRCPLGCLQPKCGGRATAHEHVPAKCLAPQATLKKAGAGRRAGHRAAMAEMAVHRALADMPVQAAAGKTALSKAVAVEAAEHRTATGEAARKRAEGRVALLRAAAD